MCTTCPACARWACEFDDADRSRPARDVVGEYYRRFEQHYDLRVRRPVSVTSVSRIDGDDGVAGGAPADGGLCVTTRSADGTVTRIRAEVVVNASGTWGTPFVPWYPGRDVFRGRQVDTTEYRSASEFAGQDVVVVGGGTSAIGFLLELDGVARSTRWFTRRPMVWAGTASLDVESAVAAVDEQDRAARAGEVLPSIVSGTGVPVSRRIRAGIDRGVLRDEPMFTRMDETGVCDRGRRARARRRGHLGDGVPGRPAAPRAAAPADRGGRGGGRGRAGQPTSRGCSWPATAPRRRPSVRTGPDGASPAR